MDTDINADKRAPIGASAAGTTPAAAAEDAPRETDALIIGAGPVGLFQIFELGLQEIRCCVLDSLAQPGGQCIELYPDKPIYDIPAIPVCTGRELTDNLLAQCKPFEPFFDLGSQVQTLARQPDGRWLVVNAAGRGYLARTVFIAAGAGAFQPQELPVPDIARFDGTQLLYRVRDREALRGQRILICGGGDSALDWANDLVDVAASVTLIHRRDKFRAAPASVARMRALQAEGRLRVVIGHAQGFTEDAGRLTGLKLAHVDGTESVEPGDVVLAFFGLSPKLGPIADWGLQIEGRQIPVNTENFETQEAGLFAVGDINTYPGKKKLILSGFHEAALAAFGATRYVFPDKRVLLQYTTTSTKLHKVLGVTVPRDD